MQNLNAVEVLSIILSVVALVITVVGFFASLKFYRDGVELQRKANDALTKIEEKTQSIQAQVGGMFDKTLDAALGKRVALTESFSELTGQLEGTKEKIIEAAVTQIGADGEQERKRLAQVVDKQIKLILDKVEITKAVVESLATGPRPWAKETPNPTMIVLALKKEGNGLSEAQLVSLTGEDPALVKLWLRRLADLGFIQKVNTEDGVVYKTMP